MYKVYGMDEKKVDLTPINKQIVPDEVSKLVEKIRGELISGQIKVKGQELLYAGTKR
ncbi:MAG: hypothetical protein HQK55_03550 [Deltaproteobacteria bacterium]|nr:hypothetical protein [Deltaproteobacteria bacterium]